MSLVVETYCSINKNGVFKNGKPLLLNEQASFVDFMKSIYKANEVGYAKFFKMDELCKLAFMSGEVLLKGLDLSVEKTGIVLGNCHSSYTSDVKHQNSIKDREDYFPSPAVFVYTLPNIMIGELCIRHKIQGENSCFLMQDFDADFINEYVRDLFQHEAYKYCITGWVDYHPDKYEAHLFLIKDSDDDSKQLLDKNILKLIQR